MAIAINGSGTITGISAGGLPDGTVDAGTLATDAVANAKVADDAVGVAELSATGTASSSTYLRGDNSWAAVASESVKVWARFDMDQGGTSIDDSYNVDSIADGATGTWQVVFDTDFANANYAILVSAGGNGNHTASFHDGEGDASRDQATTDCWIVAWGYNWSNEDHEVSIACFGDQ